MSTVLGAATPRFVQKRRRVVSAQRRQGDAPNLVPGIAQGLRGTPHKARSARGLLPAFDITDIETAVRLSTFDDLGSRSMD